MNTGRHFFRNGVHSQFHSLWPKDTPDPFSEIRGMAVLLEQGGYHIEGLEIEGKPITTA